VAASWAAGLRSSRWVGLGFALPSLNVVLLDAVLAGQAGLAAGILNSSRQVGGALAVAVFGAMVSHRAPFLVGMRQHADAALGLSRLPRGGAGLAAPEGSVRIPGNATDSSAAVTFPERSGPTLEHRITASGGCPVDWFLRLRRPVTAWVLAGLTVLLAVAVIPLSLAARQNPLAPGGTNVVIALSFAVVGLVVAWHRPRNPIGWFMLALAPSLIFQIAGGRYNVLNYRLGRQLPLAPVVLLLFHVSEPELGLIPLIILLFPDGRLPSSPRWRWLAGGYLTLALADVLVEAQMSVYAITHHRTQVDTSGQLIISNDHAYSAFFVPVALIFVAFWVLSVGYQVVSWRRATGERRQQLSWLMAGGAAALISFLATVPAGALPHGVGEVVSDVLLIGIAALPAGIGVAVLKYRLYEIDRIISRTLAYAIVTGLLVGVYAGLVLLTTQVFLVRTPVAVAASTLAAAALFTPVRRRVQRVVDRRFNRVRYDADRMVEAFAARLKDAVDLETVRADLADVVNRALEPAHITVWTARPGGQKIGEARPAALATQPGPVRRR